MDYLFSLSKFSALEWHYMHVIDQSMISICDLRKMLGGEAKSKPLPWPDHGFHIYYIMIIITCSN
jgi:hypothetical protein